MPMPDSLEMCKNHLFDDIDILQQSKLPQVIIERILRVRDGYNFWLSFPGKKEREVVQKLLAAYPIKKTTAYDDMKIIKLLLGQLNESSQAFHRWKFNQMIEKTYEMAKSNNDARGMAAASANYAKYNNLDKIEPEAKDWDIKPQPFAITENPEVLGIKRIPNISEKIKLMKEKYFNEDLEDITYEQADFEEESYFSDENK